MWEVGRKHNRPCVLDGRIAVGCFIRFFCFWFFVNLDGLP